MSTIAISGNDSLQIDGRIITDFADQDISKVSFPNDIGMMKVSKNQNAIYALNPTGAVVDMELRLIRSSGDDKYMNSRLQEWISNPAVFILLFSVFTKRIGTGDGTITSDVYQMNGGIFKKIPEAKSNAEGDVDQSVVIYNMMMILNSRSQQ